MAIIAACHCYLALIDSTSTAFSDFKQHRGKLVPFLSDDVESHANSKSFTKLRIIATYHIDKTFVISNCMLRCAS